MCSFTVLPPGAWHRSDFVGGPWVFVVQVARSASVRHFSCAHRMQQRCHRPTFGHRRGAVRYRLIGVDPSAESRVVRTTSGSNALAQSAELRPELLAAQLLLELDDRVERRLSTHAYETRRVAGTGIFGASRLVLCLLFRSRLRRSISAR